MTSIPIPKKLHLHKQSKILDVCYADKIFSLTGEYLRIHSPSAEVRGHGKPVLQTGKQNVGIRQIECVGTYAIRIHFDDEHNTGLYTWEYLFHLGENHALLWQTYLDELTAAHAFRDPHTQPVKLK